MANKPAVCKTYKITFSSNNLFYSYLRSKCFSFKGFFTTGPYTSTKVKVFKIFFSSSTILSSSTMPRLLFTNSTPSIIRSTAVKLLLSRKNYNFKSYRYATAKTRIIIFNTSLNTNKFTLLIYLNTGCIINLINKQFFLKKYFNIKIFIIITPIKIRGISSALYAANEYILVGFYLLNTKNIVAYF